MYTIEVLNKSYIIYIKILYLKSLKIYSYIEKISILKYHIKYSLLWDKFIHLRGEKIMNVNICLIPGDGIGPEIVREAKKVLDFICTKYGHTFNYTSIDMGGCSIDKYGVPLTDENIEVAKKSDAVLLGAVGGDVGKSSWYKLEPSLRPEAGLLKIRKELGLFANIRPAYLYKELAAACPLKDDIIGDGFDMLIMRELTGGIYFGDRYTKEVNGQLIATDTLSYSEDEIRRIAIKAFDIARTALCN